MTTFQLQVANLLSELGQQGEALALGERVMRARTAALGAGHPDTLTAMANLAIRWANNKKKKNKKRKGKMR